MNTPTALSLKCFLVRQPYISTVICHRENDVKRKELNSLRFKILSNKGINSCMHLLTRTRELWSEANISDNRSFLKMQDSFIHRSRW